MRVVHNAIEAEIDDPLGASQSRPDEDLTELLATILDRGKKTLASRRASKRLLAGFRPPLLLALASVEEIRRIGRVSPGQASAIHAALELGRQLFTTYLFPFEVTSVLLLVAMVGAIVLTKEDRPKIQKRVRSVK